MLERAKEATRYGKYTGIEYARFADDLVTLIDAYPRHDWLLPAVEKRLRKELAALQVEINEEKSRIVDLSRGESFGFLGFDFRRIRSERGVWRANATPKLKKRTALLRKLKEIFRRHRSQPIDRVVRLGWVQTRLSDLNLHDHATVDLIVAHAAEDAVDVFQPFG